MQLQATVEEINNVKKQHWYAKFRCLFMKLSRQAYNTPDGGTYGESRPLILLKLYFFLVKNFDLNSTSVFADIGAGIAKVLLFFCQMENCPTRLIGYELSEVRVKIAAIAIEELKKMHLKFEGVQVLCTDGLRLQSLVIL